MLEERRGSWAMSSWWYSAEEESDAAAVVSQAEREKRYVSLQPLYRWTTQSNRGKR